MQFSTEEIYSMYGQYDTFVTLEFHYHTDEYLRFGNNIMGVFLYTLEERQKYEEVLKSDEVPRTDAKIKFSASSIEKLSQSNTEYLDRYGIQVSSIDSISSLNGPRKNRFSEKGTKEIPNQIVIRAPRIKGWEELNRMRFGLLNSIRNSGNSFTPFQEIEYWGLRTHLQIDLGSKEYEQMQEKGQMFLDQIRHVELECKYHELTITEEQIQEFAKLTVCKMAYKKTIIDAEVKKSGENINKVAEDYKSEISELRKHCNSFDELVVLHGKNPIYLTFERFVHVYARHVSETQVGERFAGSKTVFQYKFEDIKSLIKMVFDNIANEIEIHFESTPQEQFRRIGKRAAYIDGHYYRVVIEPNGSILDFHPFNRSET